MENLVFSYAGSDRQVRRTASHSHRGWELLYIVSGSCVTVYAGLGLNCTGVPDILFPFFTQSAEEPKKP